MNEAQFLRVLKTTFTKQLGKETVPWVADLREALREKRYSKALLLWKDRAPTDFAVLEKQLELPEHAMVLPLPVQLMEVKREMQRRSPKLRTAKRTLFELHKDAGHNDMETWFIRAPDQYTNTYQPRSVKDWMDEEIDNLHKEIANLSVIPLIHTQYGEQYCLNWETLNGKCNWLRTTSTKRTDVTITSKETDLLECISQVQQDIQCRAKIFKRDKEQARELMLWLQTMRHYSEKECNTTITDALNRKTLSYTDLRGLTQNGQFSKELASSLSKIVPPAMESLSF